MADTKYDFYTTGGDSSSSVTSSTSWTGQTFTASDNYTINAVKFYMNRSGLPGDITVSLRATDTETGEPTGGDLASVTIDGDAVLTSSLVWITFTFDTGYSLSNGVKYALIIRIENEAGRLLIRRDASSPTYADGLYVRSTNSGAEDSWTSYDTVDFLFETWGEFDPDINLSGSIAITTSLSGSLNLKYIDIVGSIAITTSLSGSLTLDQIDMEGSIAITSGLEASLNILVLLEGSIGMSLSMKANTVTIINYMRWLITRPDDYDSTVVWDEVTQSWIYSDGRGGARYNDFFALFVQNDDGNARIYFKGV